MSLEFRMCINKAISLVPIAVVTLTVSAAAQTTAPRPAGGEQGIYVAAAAGAAFGPQTTATFGAEYGERIHRNVQAYANLSYFDNIMDRALQDDLVDLGQFLTPITGRTWELHGRDRGVTFIAGAKFVGGGGTVRPYVGGGAGVINIKRTIVDNRVGDVTRAALDEFGIGELSMTSESRTRPLIEGIGGVSFFAGRTYFDIGYRYKRAFRVSETFDLSQFGIGIGVNF